MKPISLFTILTLTLFSCKNQTSNYDVIVLGAGTGATAAAIQSARSGAKTLLVHPLPWLGGMLTSAGVSATDGNHQLPAGLWAEFREHIRNHYGGADSVFTGWVSNTMFEPHVGAKYWLEIAEKEENLTILFEANWTAIQQKNNWQVQIQLKDGSIQTSTGKILIDGTDLGDVAAAVGATYDIGMDAKSTTQEEMAPEAANDIIQDLTYTAILKDYGKNTDKTIPKPVNYNATAYYCSCQMNCDDEKAHPCETMLSYGKLPNGKYMINWPINGNDFYTNPIELNQQQRDSVYQLAKNQTLGFIYYIQTELGYKNLGLADDEFPTEDQLALMPYHREGRRIHGITQLNVNHILNPYEYDLYKTGIAVGDYPIDHHHYKNEAAPKIDFPKVPSFNIPMGCLIPKNVDNLLMADKAISVTNIVNGASRLQPVVIQIGQVAGLMAAMAAQNNISPKDLDIRQVQNKLLQVNGYLMPFIDVSPDHPHFQSIQRVAATGILKGKGIPYKWANQTWFYPDTTVFLSSWKDFMNANPSQENEDIISITHAFELITNYQKEENINFEIVNEKEEWEKHGLSNYEKERPITKAELAVLIDKIIQPFEKDKIDFEGKRSAAW